MRDAGAKKDVRFLCRDVNMTPSQMSSVLRRIAAKLDNSRNPDQNLVAAELQRVIVALEPEQKKKGEEMLGKMKDWTRKLEESVKKNDEDGGKKLFEEMAEYLKQFHHFS